MLFTRWCLTQNKTTLLTTLIIKFCCACKHAQCHLKNACCFQSAAYAGSPDLETIPATIMISIWISFSNLQQTLQTLFWFFSTSTNFTNGIQDGRFSETLRSECFNCTKTFSQLFLPFTILSFYWSLHLYCTQNYMSKPRHSLKLLQSADMFTLCTYVSKINLFFNL